MDEDDSTSSHIKNCPSKCLVCLPTITCQILSLERYISENEESRSLYEEHVNEIEVKLDMFQIPPGKDCERLRVVPLHYIQRKIFEVVEARKDIVDVPCPGFWDTSVRTSIVISDADVRLMLQF